MLLTKVPFLRDFDLNCADMKATSADIAFHSIWLLASGVNLISWIDEIPILFLDFAISRSEVWYLLMSSSVYTLRCLSPTESSGMRSDTLEITLFGWKAIESSILFLIEAPTPSTGPLPCPDSVKTQ